MTCHMHPGTNMVATYQGLTWWDNETDGDKMYPATSRKLSTPQRVGDREAQSRRQRRPRAVVAIPTFLQRDRHRPSSTTQLKQTQFADFHGHGWLFRAVFKRDRKGNLLDAPGNAVKDPTARAADRGGELHRPAAVEPSGRRTRGAATEMREARRASRCT